MPVPARTSLSTLLIAAAMTATPASVQSMSRGVLLSSTPISGAPVSASAYRIRYQSRAVGGGRNLVTGVVIVPDGPAPRGGRDVVAWAHGTSGVSESCAPSQSKALYGSIAGLKELLAAGYAVVATDYAGLGTPGPHPYLVGDGSAYSVLDSVRAAREFGRGSIGNRFVVWGESQGGHAALWTAQFARNYAPELQLEGVAAAAPPTDLKENLTGGTNPLIKALLTAYTGTSWSQTYGIPLSTILKPVGQGLARRLARNCVSTDPVALRTKIGLFRFSRSLANVDISTSPRWAEQLRRKVLLKRAGWSLREVIDRKLPLTRLPNDLKPLVRGNKITPLKAMLVNRVKNKLTRADLLERVLAGKLSTRALEDAVRVTPRKSGARSSSRPEHNPALDADLRWLELEISRHLGVKATLSPTGLHLECGSGEGLSSLLEQLGVQL